MKQENILNFSELASKVDAILEAIQKLKDGGSKMCYTSREVSEMTGIGKSVIDRMRQNGEISYSKVGQSIVFTQKDIDELLELTRVRYAS